MSASTRWVTPTAGLATIFGIATLYSGGTALFGGPAASVAAGNAVPFVFWFNFGMGFAYLLGAALLFLRHPLARPVAWAIGLATLAVFAAFGIAALQGTPFQMRTVAAMTLRSTFWLAIAITLERTRQ